MSTTMTSRTAALALAAAPPRHSRSAMPLRTAAAQTFPDASRSRWSCPSRPAAATTSWRARIAPRMAQILGQTVIVDNKPGAGGNLGTDMRGPRRARRLHAADRIEPGDDESRSSA